MDISEEFAKRDSTELVWRRTLDSKPDNDLVSKIRHTNPLYDMFSSRWAFYLDAYEGGEEFTTSSNIFQHQREHEDDYRDRIRRLAYHNYVQPLVNFFSNFIFAEEVSRFGGKHDADYQRFANNANLRGDSLDITMREVSDLVQIFGHIDILVDKPSLEVPQDTIMSLMQERELGMDKPYLVLLDPFEVVDWEFDHAGRLVYLKRREMEDGDEEKYTQWFPNMVVKTEVKKTKNGSYELDEMEQIPNLLGEVPVVRSYYQRSKKYKYMGISFIRDIAYINRKILNLTSLIDEFLYRQCVTGDTIVDGRCIRDLVGSTTTVTAYDISTNTFVKKPAVEIRKTGEAVDVWRLHFKYETHDHVVVNHIDGTANHPILKKNGKYTNLVELSVGDLLVGDMPECAYSVLRVEYKGKEDVYNMEVEDFHNYVANGIVVHNCFNILAKEVEPGLQMKEQVSGDVGTSNFMDVPRGAKFPEYISPPIDPAAFLQSEREKNILEIYRVAAQDMASEIFNGQARSGDAQNQSFSKTVPYIATRAENLEITENQIARLWLKWKDPNAVWDGKISYKDDYSITNITSFLVQLKTIISDIGVPSKTFISEEIRRLITEFDGKIDADVMATIRKELDEGINDEYLKSKMVSKPTSTSVMARQPALEQQGQEREVLGSKANIALASHQPTKQ